MTEWRDIKGYEGMYYISSDGQVRSGDRIVTQTHPRDKTKTLTRIHYGRIMKPQKVGAGYLSVGLRKNGTSKANCIHRLVAIAFIRDINEDEEVNHIDGDKTNNTLTNIEIISHRLNMIHANDVLGFQDGEKNTSAKLTKKDVREIRVLAKTMKYSDLADMYFVDSETIRSVVYAKTWSHVDEDSYVPQEPMIRIGEFHPMAKLKEQDVIHMRIYAENGMKISDIAKMYGMSPSHVYSIIIGEKWSHLNNEYPPVSVKKLRKSTIGENHVWAKLDPEKVRDIRKLLESGMKKSKVARKYNVSDGTIRQIVTGKAWAHVT